MIKPTKFISKVIEIQQLTPSIKYFKLSVPNNFEFLPGQYILVNIKLDDDTAIKRMYSIASAPNKHGWIELIITIVEDGKASTYFNNIQTDTELDIMAPMGLFSVRENEKENDMVFIGTGTGAAPFRSIIHDLISNGFKKKIVLLTGCRYEDGMLYPDEFKGLDSKYSNFEYHPIISRPRNPNFSDDKGHVQDLIKKYLPKEYNGTFYLCGLNAMIKDVTQLLIEHGVTKERIRFERYD